MPSPVQPLQRLQAQELQVPLTPKTPVPFCYLGGCKGDCTTSNTAPCFSMAKPSLSGPDPERPSFSQHFLHG